MKKKLLLGLLSLVLVFTVSGCNFKSVVKNEGEKTVKKSIKGNCEPLECIKKIKANNTVQDINKIIGFDGILTDEKNNTYTWEISKEDKITATYYSTPDKAIIDATYSVDELKNNKVSFSKYDEIQTALKTTSLTYDEFCTKVNGKGTLYSISTYTKKYVWVNKNGEYLTGSFSTTTNKCTFVVGRINKSGN